MRGKRTPNDIRVKVMGELLTGDSVPDVARRHGINEDTVNNWLKHDAQFREIAVIKKDIASRPLLEDMVADYVQSLFESLTAQAKHASTEDFLSKQDAAGLAVLHGVMADKGFRLLSAFAGAGRRGDPGPAGGDSVTGR